MHSFAGGFEHPLVDVSQEKPGFGPSGGLCHLTAVVPLPGAALGSSLHQLVVVGQGWHLGGSALP